MTGVSAICSDTWRKCDIEVKEINKVADRHMAIAALGYRLKQRLAQQYPNNIEKYMKGKYESIEEIDLKAAAWKMARI